MRKTKNAVTTTFVLLAVMLCGAAAKAGQESLPGIYHLLFLAPKTMLGPAISAITLMTSNLTATINKYGTGYYLVRPATEAEPTVAEVLAGTPFAMRANVAATVIVTGLNSFTNYKLYFVAKSTSSNVQEAVQSVAFTTASGTFTPSLNDTGITWGGSYPSDNNAGCTGEEIGAQDCSHGRDFTNNNDSDGHAGFSFTKLDADGVPLINQAADYATTPWACVQDNVTGLIWEVKTADGGLHDQNDGYSWYNTDTAINGGVDGYENPGDTCAGYVAGQPSTYCNTQAYTARVNAAGWCGENDWRMPTRTELQGIVSYDRVAPTIDTAYFPNTPSSVVWSGSPSPEAYGSDGARSVDFLYGYSGNYNRESGYQVRLVRSGQ
ncbi:MAG: DUF1566 domain-containing protein [Desulfocapsaceae bacterium]|nr:DUF1566 domain-containing protein [Desulfocapsaceae bacterium]